MATAIASKNRFDVQKADLMLAWFPREEVLWYKPDPTEALDQAVYAWPSTGTIWEIGMAHMAGTPAIVVCENKILLPHPAIQTAPWVLNTLDEGLDVCVGVLRDYAQGNKEQREGGYDFTN